MVCGDRRVHTRPRPGARAIRRLLRQPARGDVTRVTQGHSGRPLVLGKVAGVAFTIVQLVAITRIVAEVMPDTLAWQAGGGARLGRRLHAVGAAFRLDLSITAHGWTISRRMIEFYPAYPLGPYLRGHRERFVVHVARPGAARRAHDGPCGRPCVISTYTIDTVLLTAALMLATLLHQYPFVHAWLTVKVLLARGVHPARQLRTQARP